MTLLTTRALRSLRRAVLIPLASFFAVSSAVTSVWVESIARAIARRVQRSEVLVRDQLHEAVIARRTRRSPR